MFFNTQISGTSLFEEITAVVVTADEEGGGLVISNDFDLFRGVVLDREGVAELVTFLTEHLERTA